MSIRTSLERPRIFLQGGDPARLGGREALEASNVEARSEKGVRDSIRRLTKLDVPTVIAQRILRHPEIDTEKLRGVFETSSPYLAAGTPTLDRKSVRALVDVFSKRAAPRVRAANEIFTIFGAHGRKEDFVGQIEQINEIVRGHPDRIHVLWLESDLMNPFEQNFQYFEEFASSELGKSSMRRYGSINWMIELTQHCPSKSALDFIAHAHDAVRTTSLYRNARSTLTERYDSLEPTLPGDPYIQAYRTLRAAGHRVHLEHERYNKDTFLEVLRASMHLNYFGEAITNFVPRANILPIAFVFLRALDMSTRARDALTAQSISDARVNPDKAGLVHIVVRGTAHEHGIDDAFAAHGLSTKSSVKLVGARSHIHALQLNLSDQIREFCKDTLGATSTEWPNFAALDLIPDSLACGLIRYSFIQGMLMSGANLSYIDKACERVVMATDSEISAKWGSLGEWCLLNEMALPLFVD